MSGWVASLAGLYGLTLRELLHGMGVAAPARVRWLDLAPAPRARAALSNETGVAAAFMREHMTFHGLVRELVPTVLVSEPVCRRCAVEAQAATTRKVAYLREIAPWRFVCDRHRQRVSPEEMDWSLDQDAKLRDIRHFSDRLEAAAFQEPSRPFPPITRSTADCIRLVRALNERIRFRVRGGRGGPLVFVVQEIPPGPEAIMAPTRRNGLVLSAWYAWHAMSDPEAALRHTRSVTPDGARRLAMLLAGFLPGEQMIARRHVAALLGTAGRARPPGGGASGLARIGMLAPGVPENRRRHSPFEYPDFGRRFVPAFYLPGDTLAGLCAATKLRSSVRPPAVPARRIATPGRPCLPSPSPAALAPYLALVATTRAEVARADGGETRPPGGVARRAFRLLRRGGAATPPSWPGTSVR